MTRPRRPVDRRPDFDGLRERWERQRAAELIAYRHELTLPTERRARSREVIATLKQMYDLTHDPAFESALCAMQAHGFDNADAGTWRRAAAKARGSDYDVTYFPRMRHLIVRNRSTVRSAAARIAVDYWIKGQSFETLVKTLERGYRKWDKIRAAKFPDAK